MTSLPCHGKSEFKNRFWIILTIYRRVLLTTAKMSLQENEQGHNLFSRLDKIHKEMKKKGMYLTDIELKQAYFSISYLIPNGNSKFDLNLLLNPVKFRV